MATARAARGPAQPAARRRSGRPRGPGPRPRAGHAGSPGSPALEPALHRTGQQVHDQQRPDQGERDDPDPLDPPRHVRLAHDVHHRDQPHREERDDDDQQVRDLGRRHSAAQPFPATSPRSATRPDSASCRGRRVRRQRCHSIVTRSTTRNSAATKNGKRTMAASPIVQRPVLAGLHREHDPLPEEQQQGQAGDHRRADRGGDPQLARDQHQGQGHDRRQEPDQRERGEQDHQREVAQPAPGPGRRVLSGGYGMVGGPRGPECLPVLSTRGHQLAPSRARRPGSAGRRGAHGRRTAGAATVRDRRP